MRLRYVLQAVAFASMLGAIAAGIAALLSPFPGGRERLAMQLLLVAAHAVVALGLNAVRERGRRPLLMITGMALAAGGMIAMLLSTLPRIGSGGPSWWWEFLASGEAVLLLIIGIALCQPARSRLARALRRATVVLVALLMLALPLLLVVVVDGGFSDDPASAIVGRGFALLGVLAAGTLTTTLLLGRLGSLDERSASPARPLVTVTCPRCAHRGAIQVDGDRCSACGLRIRVSVD